MNKNKKIFKHLLGKIDYFEAILFQKKNKLISSKKEQNEHILFLEQR